MRERDLYRGYSAVYVGELAIVHELLAAHVHLHAVGLGQQRVVELHLRTRKHARNAPQERTAAITGAARQLRADYQSHVSECRRARACAILSGGETVDAWPREACCCMSKHAAACRSMLLHVEACCCMSKHAAACRSMLLHVEACCCMLKHAAACRSMLLHVKACCCMSKHVEACCCISKRAAACRAVDGPACRR
jgi:hypothetical protein